MAQKPKFIPKYRQIADAIRLRILQGNYALKPVPSERRLAREFETNYMTVRRGLSMLAGEGLLTRGSNKRMHTRHVREGGKHHLNLAFLTHSPFSGATERWQQMLGKITALRACSVRVVHYLNWEDPVLADSIAGFDGVFLSPAPDAPPAAVLDLLRNSKRSVVLGGDFSIHGIPSIRTFPPVSVHRLLDHLKSLGHHHIGCINTQTANPETRECIDQWRLWMGLRGFSGRLINESVPAFENPAGFTYKVMKDLLFKTSLVESAWFCATIPVALGTMRAFLDCGLVPGEDVAICAANSEGVENLSNPRITSVECADATPYLSLALDWMSKGEYAWEGALLMQPAEVPLTIHESTERIESAGAQLMPELIACEA